MKAYYTAWYPNDGEIKEVGERKAEQAIEVSDVALLSSRSMTWSAADIAPGRYYFVVVVDPENAICAYRMQRVELKTALVRMSGAPHNMRHASGWQIELNHPVL